MVQPPIVQYPDAVRLPDIAQRLRRLRLSRRWAMNPVPHARGSVYRRRSVQARRPAARRGSSRTWKPATWCSDTLAGDPEAFSELVHRYRSRLERSRQPDDRRRRARARTWCRRPSSASHATCTISTPAGSSRPGSTPLRRTSRRTSCGPRRRSPSCSTSHRHRLTGRSVGAAAVRGREQPARQDARRPEPAVSWWSRSSPGCRRCIARCSCCARSRDAVTRRSAGSRGATSAP